MAEKHPEAASAKKPEQRYIIGSSSKEETSDEGFSEPSNINGVVHIDLRNNQENGSKTSRIITRFLVAGKFVSKVYKYYHDYALDEGFDKEKERPTDRELMELVDPSRCYYESWTVKNFNVEELVQHLQDAKRAGHIPSNCRILVRIKLKRGGEHENTHVRVYISVEDMEKE